MLTGIIQKYTRTFTVETNEATKLHEAQHEGRIISNTNTHKVISSLDWKVKVCITRTKIMLQPGRRSSLGNSQFLAQRAACEYLYAISNDYEFLNIV